MTSTLSHHLMAKPEPVEAVPAKAPFANGGRKKTNRYVKLQEQLAATPGVPHLVATLPAKTPTAKERSRRVAAALRSTLKRYGVTLEERTLHGTLSLYGTYTNGTSAD